MGRSTPSSIRENYDVMRRVGRGEISPNCQRAKRAARVTARYPGWNDQELEVPELPAAYRMPSVDRYSVPKPVVSRATAPAPALQRSGFSRDRDVFVRVLFGSAAPQAQKALDFLSTQQGQKAMSVGVLAFGALITTRL